MMRISLPSNWGLDSGAGFVLVVDALVDEFTAVWEGATDDGTIGTEAFDEQVYEGISWASAFNEQVDNAVHLTRALIWSMLYTLLVSLTVAALIAQGGKQPPPQKKVIYNLKEFCISPCGTTEHHCDEPMKIMVRSTCVQPTCTTTKCLILQKSSSDEETYEIDTDEDDEDEEETEGSSRPCGDRSIFRTQQKKDVSPDLVQFSRDLGSDKTMLEEDSVQTPPTAIEQVKEKELRSNNKLQKEVDATEEQDVETGESDMKDASLEVANPDVVRNRSIIRAEPKDTRENGKLQQGTTAGVPEGAHVEQDGIEEMNGSDQPQKDLNVEGENSLTKQEDLMDGKDAAFEVVRRRSVFFGTHQNLKDAIGTQKLEGKTGAKTAEEVLQKQENDMQGKGKEMNRWLSSNKENRTSTHEDLKALKDSISVLQKLLRDSKEAA